MSENTERNEFLELMKLSRKLCILLYIHFILYRILELFYYNGFIDNVDIDVKKISIH